MIIIYLIKSTLCLAILFVFYKIALENKAMHQFKRFYLLASLIFAFTIPLVTFTYQTETVAPPIVTPILTAYTTPVPIDAATTEIAAAPSRDHTEVMLWSIYGLGVLIFGVRFGLNLFRLKRKIETAHTIQERDFTLALLGKTIVPHSFFKWIFISRKHYEQQEIAPEVLAHEATHVREKHSVDIILIEILQVVFWFNPLLWFAKVAIKLNHEFLADQGALKSENDIYHYQNILLSYASSTHLTALESPFNYSLTKKRIVMLSQSFSRKKVLLRALLLVPIAGLCVLLFNQAIIAQSKTSEQSGSSVLVQEKLTARSITITFLDEDYMRVDGSKIRKKELYNALWRLHTDMTRAQRNDYMNIHVSSQGDIAYEDLVYLQKVATTYGYYRIVTPYEEIIRAKGNEPAKPEIEAIPHDNYALEFVQGAAQNDKKAIVIEIRNDQIKINGKQSSLSTLRKDIDAITKDWEETDFTDAVHTFMFKGNSDAFLAIAEEEFQKTHFSKANDGMKLIPPPPPAPEAPQAPQATIKNGLPSKYTVSQFDKQLLANKKRGGTFYYLEKQVYFEKARKIVQTTPGLSVNTNGQTNTTYIRKSPSEIAQIYPKYIDSIHRGGKLFFMVFENNEISINDEKITLRDFAKKVDYYTRNWTDKDYARNGKEVLLANCRFDPQMNEKWKIAINSAFRNTQLSKKAGRANLIPNEMPKLPTVPPPPPPPPSPLKYLEKMNELGGKFYQEEREISYKDALTLIKTYKQLNIQTPVPYTNPPKTYITKYPMLGAYNNIGTENTNYGKREQVGDTVLFSNGYDEKFLMVKDSENSGRVISKRPEDPGVTKKELDTYNSLAKIYNKQPKATRKIPLEDLKVIERIYRNMNTTQRIKNEPFPECDVENKERRSGFLDVGEYRNDALAQNEQEVGKLPKPTRFNILDHLRVMNRHNATFIFEGEQISFKEAMRKARKDRTMDVTSFKEDEEKGAITYLKSKGRKAVFDEEHKLFRQDEVTIYYKDEVITEAEAKQLIFAKPKKVSIDILSQSKKKIVVALVAV